MISQRNQIFKIWAMKNYIYKVELLSGFYESYFYRQVSAKSEKDAIIQIVSFCEDLNLEKANSYLRKSLGYKWTVNSFWKEHSLKFENEDGTVAYNLIWIKQVPFNLDSYDLRK